MKIKSDFITNSSSSSFIALGIYETPELPDELLLKFFAEEISRLEEYRANNPENWEKWTYRKDMYENMVSLSETEDKLEHMREMISEDGIGDWVSHLGISSMDSDYGTYVGIYISTLLRDHRDLKFGEAKAFVAEKFNDVFGTNFTEKDISYIEESWYNG